MALVYVPNEGSCCVVSDRLRQHCLAATGRSVHQYTARWVNTDLLVQLEVCKRQFDGFADFLLLHVHATNVRVLHVRLFVRIQHRDGAVRLRWQNVHQRIAVLVQGDTGRRLQQLPVNGGQNAHVVVGPGGRTDDTGVLIDRLQELANYERHRLDALHLFLRVQVLLLQVALLILDVLFLHLQELEHLLQLLWGG